MWELLAGAELLAGIGHFRSALTEAVTALEVEIFEFTRQPDAQKSFGHLITTRMNVPSLTRWVERKGLSGTINYLFPVIFSEEKIPTDLLKTCQEAIEKRQNIVHKGTRVIREDQISLYLQAIRNLCHILESYKDDDLLEKR